MSDPISKTTGRRVRLYDQCEYPDRRAEPGDTCTNIAARNRRTRFGTMWLCGEHFGAPVKDLFDERLSHVEA